MHEPVEVVVDRMVDPAVVFTAVADVERRNPEVIEERGVVGPGAERSDAKILSLSGVAANFSRAVEDSRCLHSLP